MSQHKLQGRRLLSLTKYDKLSTKRIDTAITYMVKNDLAKNKTNSIYLSKAD